MVFPPAEGYPMAAAAEDAREKPPSSHLLHPFSFPNSKRWGNQRMLRCANVNRKGEIIGGDRRSAPPAAAGERRALPSVARIRGPEEEKEGGGGDDDDGGLEELREKLMGHLREAADRMKIDVPPPFLRAQARKDVPATATARAPEAEPSSSPAEAARPPVPLSSPAEAARPWILRTRSKDPIGTGRRQPSSKHAPAPSAPERRGRERTVRLRSESAERRERPKFSVSLTREEIEEDIYSMTGSRPRRRPKKRPRIIQRQLDSVFPGLWVSEITVDSYKVPDD